MEISIVTLNKYSTQIFNIFQLTLLLTRMVFIIVQAIGEAPLPRTWGLSWLNNHVSLLICKFGEPSKSALIFFYEFLRFTDSVEDSRLKRWTIFIIS